MTSISTISGRARAANPDLFRMLHRARHSVFIEKLSWSLPARGNLDVDQYDADEAQYFYGLNPDGSVRCHVRLTPTTKYSLMADYFPHLVENGCPIRGEAIHEGTRFFVQTSERTRQSTREAMSALMAAMFYWGLENGVTQIQTVIESWALPQYMEMSSKAQPLGLAHPYGGGPNAPGGGEAMGIRCPVSADVVAELRAFAKPPGGLNGGRAHAA